MGILNHLFYPWSLLLQVFALIHFFRRRPDTYWLFIIVFLGPLGALIYLCMEALPDIGLIGQSVKVFPRRKRIGELEIVIRDNPAPGNFEELGHLYMDDGKFAQARAAFDQAISARIDSLDTFYRRGVCALQLGDYAAALPDLERTVAKEPDYDFHRAAGLLAHAYARNRKQGKSGGLVPPGRCPIHIVGNVFEFCGLLIVGRPIRRGEAVGTEGAGQAAFHARLPAPA